MKVSQTENFKILSSAPLNGKELVSMIGKIQNVRSSVQQIEKLLNFWGINLRIASMKTNTFPAVPCLCQWLSDFDVKLRIPDLPNSF